jgi:DNA-binding transcriptional ArsR family regulator
MEYMTPDLVFKALSDPTRRALFERLCQDGELTVQALTKGAAVSQPAVSKHLVVLREAGLVRLRPEGRQSHYSAQPEALVPLSNWVRLYSSFWAGRLDALTEMLSRMDT